MARLQFASHVHVCFTEQQAILLDLRRDEYLGLSLRDSGVLAQALEVGNTAADGTSSASAEHELAARLASQGLIARPGDHAAITRSHHPPRRRPRHSLAEQYIDRGTPITMGEICAVLTASLLANVDLRIRSLDSIVTRVRQRKSRLPADRHHASAPDMAALQSRVSVFMRLYTLLFGARGTCISSSLALSNYLARHRLAHCWVFGVAVRPFIAHCWLQCGDVVLNDSVGHARKFTPILSV